MMSKENEFDSNMIVCPSYEYERNNEKLRTSQKSEERFKDDDVSKLDETFHTSKR